MWILPKGSMIFNVHQVKEKGIEQNMEPYVVCIDLSEASATVKEKFYLRPLTL